MIVFELQFSSIGEFFQMGRYTFHVWTVYALFTLFLAYNLVMPLWQRKQFIRQQAARMRRESQRGKAADSPAATPRAGDSSQER